MESNMEDNKISPTRRNLLKTGLMVAGGCALGLTGCAKQEKTDNYTDELPFTPAPPDVYKFSAPLLFYTDYINSVDELNKNCKKSKVTTLYNSLPWPLAEKYNEWFMLSRGGANPSIKSYEDFERYVKYAQDKGFDVVYLMNSPKPFEDKDIDPIKKDFHKLLDKIWNSGIRTIKFANTQVAQLINEYNPEFKLSVATILEYSSLWQYQNLVSLFPNISHICIPKDQNQNFKFFQSLKKAFPNIEIEIMADEGCSKGCPTRLMCMSMRPNRYKLGCFMDRTRRVYNSIFNGIVHPWDMSYYAAAGIDSFKLVTRSYRHTDNDCPGVKLYMKIIESGYSEETLKEYIHTFFALKVYDVNVRDFISCLPDIRHFVLHGHECDSKCGVDCKYCYQYLDKLGQYVRNNA